MKNLLLISILVVLCFACSDKVPVLKTLTIIEYSTKTELGELVKGEIIKKYSIGFYPNGSQEFYFDLNNDTIKFEVGTSVEEKKVDNKTFFYNSKNELTQVNVEKGDTIFIYKPDDLEYPSYYHVLDKKKRLLVEAELSRIFGEKRTYTQAKYNKYGACTYALIKVDYEPSNYDKKYLNELEIAKKRADKKEPIIFEAEYTYY